MHRNQSVSAHSFAMVPRADIPRSRFNVQTSHKTTFDAGKLIPIYVDEVLPGDTFSLSCTAFGRMATPIFPIMDNLHMDTFFFFVPYRLIWDNWKRFMGEQRNPGDSTSFLVPQVSTPVGGWPIGSIGDYFGLPTVGQVSAGKSVVERSVQNPALGLPWLGGLGAGLGLGCLDVDCGSVSGWSRRPADDRMASSSGCALVVDVCLRKILGLRCFNVCLLWSSGFSSILCQR